MYLLLQAYHRKMYAPSYVWMLPVWYNEGWWNNTVNVSCTTENMMTVVNGTLGTVPHGAFVMDNKTRKAISGLVRNI